MSKKSNRYVTTKVHSVENIGHDILLISLADPADWYLPPFTPGSHIDLHLESGKVRQYSLCGDSGVGKRYLIAVKHEDGGRGGSAEIHDTIKVGNEVLVSLPRNHFPISNSDRHIMVAGGIGITPFLSMLPALRRAGVNYALHFCTRSLKDTPFLELLEPEITSGNVMLHHSGDGSRLDLAELIGNLEPDASLYCCGPEKMISEIGDVGSHLGERLNIESFGLGEQASDPSYQVKLSQSGRVITVQEGQTMLEALRDAGVDIEYSCEAGVCLDCKTRLLSGEPVHRDLVMTTDDRKLFITPCVSGSKGSLIELEI